MAAKYRLAADDMVVRNADEAWIPPDIFNVDRQQYLKWQAEGGVPDPYIGPPTLSSLNRRG